MKINQLIVLLSSLLVLNGAIAQNTFSFELKSEYVKRSEAAIEDDDGNIITILSQAIGQDYTPQIALQKARLLIFNPNGDTTTVNYMLGDTVFDFTTITKYEEDGYLVAGYSTLPETDSSFLLLLKVDEQLNRNWVRQYYFEDVDGISFSKLIVDENGFYGFGRVSFHLDPKHYPIFARFDNQGNLVRYHIYPDNSTSGYYEYTFNPAKNRIWLFSGPGLDPLNNSSKAVFDTTFNHLYSEVLPLPTMWLMYVQWKNDTSFYLSYQGYRDNIPSPDHEVCIALYDTLMNRSYFGEFGEQDSDDYPGQTKSFDFLNSDTIYYTGTIDMYWGFPPVNYTNWIMIGQTDSTLQDRYRYFMGGDAYYITYFVLALRDGGCFVNARKFNHETGVFDIIYLKLNREGQLVYISDPTIQLSQFLVYPNPATDHFYVEGPERGYEIELHNQSGQLLKKVQAKSSKISINTTGYSKGVYILTLLVNGQIIETKKIVKQ